MPNKNVSGGSWTQQEIDAVWAKGSIVSGQSPMILRKDCRGTLIEYLKHGDTTPNGRGWEIDHIKPVAKGGNDDIQNLQPLQWENNREKGDKWP